MPRYYRKRYQKKKTFSKSNLYRKRGSKSQANQIYRLNKRISNVYKNLGGTCSRLVPQGALPGISWPDALAQQNPYLGTNFAWTYYPNNNLPPEMLFRGMYMNVDIAFKYPVVTYSMNGATTPTIWFRIFAVQWKQAGEDYTINDFLTNYQSLTGIHEPFAEHTGNKCKVILDVKTFINQDKPERHFKLKYKKHFKIKQVQGVGVQKNHVKVFIISYNQGADQFNYAAYGVQAAALLTVSRYNYVVYDHE